MVQRLVALVVSLVLVCACLALAWTSPVAPRFEQVGSVVVGGPLCPLAPSCVQSAAGNPDSGTFSVSAGQVAYGPVMTKQGTAATSSGAGSSISMQLPLNSAGNVTAIVSGMRVSDGGSAVSTSTTITCGAVTGGSGGCGSTTTCSASSPWSVDAGASWTATLMIDDTCRALLLLSSASDPNPVHWGAVLQYIYAQ